MFTILMGEDEGGKVPLLLRDGEAILNREARRWHVVATTDDPAEAASLMELLKGYASVKASKGA